MNQCHTRCLRLAYASKLVRPQYMLGMRYIVPDRANWSYRPMTEAVLYNKASLSSCMIMIRQAMVFAWQQVCSSHVLTLDYMLSNKTRVQHDH